MAIYIPDEKIQAIKNASDIVDIVSEHVSLRRAGRNFIGLCPFHSEKTPSFTVSPDKQIFYCFGCGAGGNVFSFVMKQEGMGFPETARALAKRYGIDLPTGNLSPREKQRLTEREKILSLNSDAMSFFQDALARKEYGGQAMAYLIRRGLTKKTIDAFRLGFAPDGWDHLLRYLSSRKKSVDIALKAGLIIPRKSGGGHYDRFRNRIVFPIFDGQMLPIGFGGRVMDDSLPKYLNGPETPVYNKSRSLYGFHRARQKCRQEGCVYVVEGYFDLVAMHQFGMENTVATLGTSLTADHVQMLKSQVGPQGKAILVYDSDRAGVKAAQRSVGVFQKGLLDARILILPEGEDPDSFLMKNGPDEFAKVADQAMDMMVFMVEAAVEKYGLGIEGKVRIVDEVKPAILAVDDPVARSLRVKYLAERIDVKESAVLQKVRYRTGPAEQSRAVLPDGKTPMGAVPLTAFGRETSRMERQLVTMMLQMPETISAVAKKQLVNYFSDSVLAVIGRGIIKNFATGGGDIASLISRWEEPEIKAMVARLSMTDENWNREGCMRLINQFESSIRRRDKGLLKQIQAAEKSGDDNLLVELLQEKQNQVVKRMEIHGGNTVD